MATETRVQTYRVIETEKSDARVGSTHPRLMGVSTGGDGSVNRGGWLNFQTFSAKVEYFATGSFIASAGSLILVVVSGCRHMEKPPKGHRLMEAFIQSCSVFERTPLKPRERLILTESSM